MPCIQGEIVILRPTELVFDFIADGRDEPRYNPRIVTAEQLSTRPMGPGTRFRAEMNMRRRSVPMIIECTEYQHLRRLASSTHHSSMEIEGARTFEPFGEGTRMRWQGELKPRGALRPIIGRVEERQETRTGLKRLLEAEAA